ncbi:DUF1674 domain-containing protein [Bartonella sp. DGB1]|uniref:DUF1674 domain-containing protein n=1 Tax=Bartonella sp. DGB1 TaxID=3239807 RepID=UPI003523672F
MLKNQNPTKILTPAAIRALTEAEERNAQKKIPTMPEEFGGRDGAEPTRFGDWENKGRAIDF